MLNPDGPVNRVAMLNRTPRTHYTPTPYMLFQPPKKGRRAALKGWLARKCWGLLERLGALMPYQEKIVTFTYTETHRKAVNALAFAAYKAADALGMKPDDLVFVMGAEDFRTLVSGQDRDFHEFHHFRVHGGQFFRKERECDPRLGHPLHSYRTSIHDIPVHVVPWMKGMAVVPKIVLEEKVAA